MFSTAVAFPQFATGGIEERKEQVRTSSDGGIDQVRQAYEVASQIDYSGQSRK